MLFYEEIVMCKTTLIDATMGKERGKIPERYDLKSWYCVFDNLSATCKIRGFYEARSQVPLSSDIL